VPQRCSAVQWGPVTQCGEAVQRVPVPPFPTTEGSGEGRRMQWQPPRSGRGALRSFCSRVKQKLLSWEELRCSTRSESGPLVALGRRRALALGGFRSALFLRRVGIQGCRTRWGVALLWGALALPSCWAGLGWAVNFMFSAGQATPPLVIAAPPGFLDHTRSRIRLSEPFRGNNLTVWMHSQS